jgi:hypothetical protein
MTTITAHIIDMFNSLPRQEQDEVRLLINKESALRAELNYELERAKKSPVLTASEAGIEWERFGVKTS